MVAKVIGILNFTPDSFTDGGKYNKLSVALERINELFRQGADIIDVGAQSTSYGSIQLTAEKEWSKISTLLENIEPQLRDKISIDSYNYLTIRNAINLGYKYINDISGGRNQEILELIAMNPQVRYLCMFSLVIPADKNIRIKESNEIFNWASEVIYKCQDSGISDKQIILDPGIGFSTNPEQSFEIIKDAYHLKKFGVETCVGHSRKSFLESITDLPPQDRDIETLTASLFMYDKVDYLRVHNVEMHKRAFKVWEKLYK